jgi:hypothetical protein
MERDSGVNSGTYRFLQRGCTVAIEPIKVWELVDRAVAHKWSVPEFQRGFVWKATQVRDLAESLWLEFPIGSLLLWNSDARQEERVAKDGARPSLWIVDGQQRTTALAILFGRKPYWWASAEEWNKLLKRYDVRFDIAAKSEPYFLVANAPIRRTKGNRYVPLCRLLVLDMTRDADQKALSELAREIKVEGLCDGMDAMEVYARLDRVRKIRDNDVLSVTVKHELEDVVEIFSRLNSRGTRVTEADIYLGVVASKNPGWVRDQFLPFLNVLSDSGFHLDPNLLFRSLTAVGIKKVRFKDIDDAFWEKSFIEPAWKRSQAAWKQTVRHLQDYGVLSDDPLPTQAALIVLVSLLDRFPNNGAFDPAFYWFVQASRFGRYSGSGATALEEDLKDVGNSADIADAVVRLLKRFPVTQPIVPEDFKRDYTDGKFWRFLLYLLVYRNGAQDWDGAGTRLGFDGKELLADFRPQWHHIYPQKFLEKKIEADKIDALANFAVIGPNINIRISAQDPMKYLDKYTISNQKLNQQFVHWKREDFTVEKFADFMDSRAAKLADEANKYLLAHSKTLPETCQPNLKLAASINGGAK